MQAARAAGATAVAVSTGPHRAPDLWDGGAHVVLASLTDFPAWWARHVAPG